MTNRKNEPKNLINVRIVKFFEKVAMDWLLDFIRNRNTIAFREKKKMKRAGIIGV
jgi:hypothetical protein